MSMQNQTMDVFKKLGVARRRNHVSGSVVSDDDGRDEVDSCHFRDSAGDDMLVEDGDVGGATASNMASNCDSSSLYGRRRCSVPRVMNVMTSNRFDNDETFSKVARAMIFRHQQENMSERGVVEEILGKTDDLRAFIEVLDLKYMAVTADGDVGDDDLSEIVFKMRSIFDTTLKAMWQEIESVVSMEDQESRQQHRVEMIVDADEYRQQHPKTPKNLRMSPMRTSSFNYKNHGFISQSESLDSNCSEGSSLSIFRPFKRPRRWFFPHGKKNEGVVTPTSVKNNNPFAIKTALPKFHFNFGSKNSSKSTLIADDTSRETKTVVKTSRVDGEGRGGGGQSSSFMPPTSPIRQVSSDNIAVMR